MLDQVEDQAAQPACLVDGDEAGQSAGDACVLARVPRSRGIGRTLNQRRRSFS
jgi:hypothetical protein